MSGAPIWVVHRGALGDSVLLWPLLRSHRSAGREVVLVADASKARLVAGELGITGLDAESPRLNRLWREAPVDPVPGVAEVVWFAPEGAGAGAPVFEANLARMFPGARVTPLPGRPDAPFARAWTDRGGGATLRENPRGPVVLHVGAGSRSKRWPMERWEELAAALSARGLERSLVAGEVEREQFSAEERARLEAAGGEFLERLEDLAAVLTRARLVIAADSGPAHLAAQLGIPTVALFGPSDSQRWAPVGPRVAVIAPPEPAGMDWLQPDRAAREALSLLGLR